MNAADFDELPASEREHFYRCEQCGEMVDMRQMDDVLFHEDSQEGFCACAQLSAHIKNARITKRVTII